MIGSKFSTGLWTLSVSTLHSWPTLDTWCCSTTSCWWRWTSGHPRKSGSSSPTSSLTASRRWERCKKSLCCAVQHAKGLTHGPQRCVYWGSHMCTVPHRVPCENSTLLPSAGTGWKIIWELQRSPLDLADLAGVSQLIWDKCFTSSLQTIFQEKNMNECN